MAQHKLECVEVIQTREAVQKLDICGDKILVLTQNNVLKVLIDLSCHPEQGRGAGESSRGRRSEREEGAVSRGGH